MVEAAPPSVARPDQLGTGATGDGDGDLFPRLHPSHQLGRILAQLPKTDGAHVRKAAHVIHVGMGLQHMLGAAADLKVVAEARDSDGVVGAVQG